jgi:hypothetical protein
MKKIAEIAARLLSYPLLGLVYFYRYAISPLKPPTCRHTPTCSEYMIQSLKIHGPIKGLWLGFVGYQGAILGARMDTIRFLQKEQKYSTFVNLIQNNPNGTARWEEQNDWLLLTLLPKQREPKYFACTQQRLPV